MLLVDSDGIPPMSCDDKGCPMAARKYTNAVPEIMRHGAVELQNQRLATGRFGGCLASRANRCPVQLPVAQRQHVHNADRITGTDLSEAGCHIIRMRSVERQKAGQGHHTKRRRKSLRRRFSMVQKRAGKAIGFSKACRSHLRKAVAFGY